MATTAAEARLVKSPKCSKLLREVPNFPMYRCGGCGAILRAKDRGSSKQCVSLAPETSSRKSLPSGIAGIGEPSSAKARDIKEKVSEDADLLATSKSNENGRSEAKTDYSFNQEEEEEIFLRIKEHDSDRSMQSNNLRSSTARQMSQRTIRDQRFSGSDSTKSKGGGENVSRNSSVDSDAQRRRRASNSEPFFSVQIWVESEEEVPSRSLSRDSASSELLKLVGELRDLSGKKPRSWSQQQKMPLSCSHCHPEPNLCCCNNNSLCAACSYSFCCRSSKSERSAQRRKARARKSYCRPVSGGAPFFVCSKCFEVLHMPADLLVSTGCSNKLKCGACSETMVLSFPARPLLHEDGKPPEDPISFSDEYGVDSFADGSSTEAEPVVNVPSASSRRAMGDGSRASGATLHRLMGYPSARQLLF